MSKELYITLQYTMVKNTLHIDQSWWSDDLS